MIKNSSKNRKRFSDTPQNNRKIYAESSDGPPEDRFACPTLHGCCLLESHSTYPHISGIVAILCGA